MRVLLVQYTGDFRETVERLSRGGEETYYAQKYSLNTIAAISQQVEEIAALVCVTPERYNEVLSNGIRGIGAGFSGTWSDAALIDLIEQQRPTHLIVTTPINTVFQWAIRHRVPTIAVLADSFQTSGLRNRWRNYKLARLLNHPQIEWVGNHNINSSRSLQQIGVHTDKIVPWDWPPVKTPEAFSPKHLELGKQPKELVYVGSLMEAKGVGDSLSAIADLRARNLPVKLRLAGKGDTDRFRLQAKQLGIEDAVEFLGLIPNTKVVHLMRDADAVIIPSRHEYPEGLPMTIYEALCARTPIVASDHPMFQSKLQDGKSAVVFPASNASALADAVATLFHDADLYHRLSLNAQDAWEHLQIPVKFGDFLNHWLFDPPSDRPWLSSYTLASGLYA